MNEWWMQWLGADLVTRIASTLLHFVWQGAAIGLAYALLRRVVARRSPTRRYWLGCLALASCVAWPVLTFIEWESATSPEAVLSQMNFSVNVGGNPIEITAQEQLIAGPNGAVVRVETTATASPGRVEVQFSGWPKWEMRMDQAAPWLVLLWMGGVLLLSGRMGFGWLALQSLRAGAAPVKDAMLVARFRDLADRLRIRARVKLLASSHVECPMSVGWLKPAVLLPVSAISGMPREQLEVILAHELAHVRRGDYLMHMLQCGVETVLFYHPVVWWISRDISVAREECCDDLALQCGSRTDLAQALCSLEEARMRAPMMAQGAAGNGTLARVKRLLGAQPPKGHESSSRWVMIVGASLVFALLLGTMLQRVMAADPVIEVKPGESLQAAIDRAPEGSIIKLAEGVFKERITVRKPLTLEGAGSGKTILRPDKPEPGVTPEAAAAAYNKIQGAKTDEEKIKLSRAYTDTYEKPTLLIEKAKGVQIAGLRIQGIPTADADGMTGDRLVSIREAQAEIRDCVILGPYMSGIAITEGANVGITRCLVAGVWDTGVAIYRGNLGHGAPPTVRLTDSDVRNCYHRCITISCDDVQVRNCRISGSAWHGIRYDDASPTIEGNLIFGNARSGIYASGNTRAAVRGNVMFANEMGAVSCWFANKDTYEGNTFAGNLREAVSVLGASHPTIKNNIFAVNPIGVYFGKIGEKSVAAQTMGRATLENNVFWKNAPPIKEGDDAKTLGGSNREADPMFSNAGARNFNLQPDSPLRREGIGAAKMMALTSPWPVQPEEKRMIPATETRSYQQWKKPAGTGSANRAYEAIREKAFQDSQDWVKGALQIDDKTRREASISAILAALRNREAPAIFRGAGLEAFNRIDAVAFDRGPFREVLLVMLASDDADGSSGSLAIWQALKSCGFKDGDLAGLLKLAESSDPIVLHHVTPLLVAASKGRIDGPAESAILKALSPALIDELRTSSGGESIMRENMRHLGDVELPPALEARILELCRDATPRIHRLAFHYALAPQKKKGEAEVAALAKFLAHEDIAVVVSRALWGFESGIEGEQRRQAADVIAKLIEARVSPSVRIPALKLLAKYADASHADFCKAELAKPGLSEGDRAMLNEILSRVQKKPQ